MEHEYIQPIVLALLFGTASYALANRLKVPAILSCLPAGVASGIVLSRLVLARIVKSGDPALPGMVAFAGALAVFWASNQVSAFSGFCRNSSVNLWRRRRRQCSGFRSNKEQNR